MSATVSFNLVEKGWLPVRWRNGSSSEVGLFEAFKRAEEIAGLNVEFPTQEPALLRLLLACCYRALQGPKTEDDWKALWQKPTLPAEQFRDYFKAHSDRFDLFGSEFPFFQSATLEPFNPKNTGAWKEPRALISYAPPANGVPLFVPISHASEFALSPAETARWVVERHAWGTTADKTGARGNQRGNPIDDPSLGHLGWIGFVAPVGESLRETLLLNLIPLDRLSPQLGIPGGGEPCWERESPDGSHQMRPPNGICDLFTWQGRRIRVRADLVDGEVRISSVMICAGDVLPRPGIDDPHTSWRPSKDADGKPTRRPIRAEPGQQVWRGLSSLLALGDTNNRAPVLSWIASSELLGTRQISLLVMAAVYGANSSTLSDLARDRLDLPQRVLVDDQAAVLANDAVQVAHQVAVALGTVAAAQYLKYKKGDNGRRGEYHEPQDPATKAQMKAAQRLLAEELYAGLDAEYRKFLVDLGSLSDDADARTRRQEWAKLVAGVARDLIRETLASLPSSRADVAAWTERHAAARIRAVCKTFIGTTQPGGS